MNKEKLREYGGQLLADGTLQMRDPNDNARHRYQYRTVDGQPCRRMLPETGDYNPPAQWEAVNLASIAATNRGYHPILDYFEFDPLARYRR